MKWIGQHIWDFISRFRATVYLENLETSSDENVLVVDSDGKVTKNTTLGGADLTYNGSTANGILTYGSASTIDVESEIIYHDSVLQIMSSTTEKPIVKIISSNTDAEAPTLSLQKTANGVDGDDLGKIDFLGDDVGGNVHTFAQVLAEIAEADDGSEEGKLTINVASHDAELQPGLIIASGDVEDEVDVTIASGTASMTTIAGDLDIDGDNMTSAGAMTFTPVGLYTITAPDLTGDVFHLDANADTDNIVNIDAGSLDIDASNDITLDAADDIAISAADDLILSGKDDVTLIADSEDALLTIASAHVAGQAIHIDGDADAGSIVDIDAGILDIDVTGASSVSGGGLLKIDAAGVEIENTSATGAPALLIDNDDVDQLSLNITTAQTTNAVFGIGMTGNPVDAAAVVIECNTNAAEPQWRRGFIDVDLQSSSDLNPSATKQLYLMDLYAIDSATSNHSTSSTQMSGINIALTAANSNNTVEQTGLTIACINGDIVQGTYGIKTAVPDGCNDLICVSSAEPDDYFSLAVGEDGETTFTTNEDGGGSTAHMKFNADGDITLDAAGDIEINADGGVIDFKDDTAQLANISTNGLDFTDNLGAGIIFEGATDDAHKTTLSVVDPTGTRAVNLPDAGGTVALTDDTAGGQYWHVMVPGYKTNLANASYYYTIYRGWYENWSNSDNNLSSMSYTDSYSGFFIAPRAGKVTNLKIQGTSADTGFNDPFKFYIYKVPMVNDSTTISPTAMFNTSTITPATINRTWTHTEDFTSSNTFAEDDMLFIFLKKDSHSANQDLYFNINVNGVYT